VRVCVRMMIARGTGEEEERKRRFNELNFERMSRSHDHRRGVTTTAYVCECVPVWGNYVNYCLFFYPWTGTSFGPIIQGISFSNRVQCVPFGTI
jgi:hypothetical protein